MTIERRVPTAIHEFPEDVFTKEQRKRGAVLLHVLCVRTQYSPSTQPVTVFVYVLQHVLCVRTEYSQSTQPVTVFVHVLQHVLCVRTQYSQSTQLLLCLCKYSCTSIYH